MSSPEEIILRAKELGQTAIAITDHGSVSALPELFKYGKKHGVKPIIGCEFYVVHDDNFTEEDRAKCKKEGKVLGKRGEVRRHFIAIARNWEGMKCIFRKLTLANQQKFNGRPRLLYSQLFDFNDCFVSLACAISLMTRPDYEEIATKFQATYGPYFYLEIIHASFRMRDPRPKKEQQALPMVMPDQAKLVNMRNVEMFKKYGIPLVCTHDSHFTTPDQADAFEYLLAIQTGAKIHEKTLDQGGSRFFFGDGDIYIKSKMELYLTMKKLGYIDDEIIKMAINNTNIVGDRCNVEMPEFSFNLPKPYADVDDNEIFDRKIKEGFAKLDFFNVPNVEEYKARVSHEVRVIKKLDLVRYFLIVEDLMRFCRDKGIGVGSARGCYTGDAKVWTTTGYKNISDVKIGDNVINEDGVIDVVKNTFKYDIEEEMYEIDHMFGSNTFCPKVCTGDHKQLTHKNGTIEWKRTDEIDNSFDLCIPKLKPLNKEIKTIDLNNYNDFGYDFDEEFIYESARTTKSYEFSIRDLNRRFGISRNCVKNYAIMSEKTSKKTISIIEKITGMTRVEYSKYVGENSFVVKKIKRFINVDENFNHVIGLVIGDGWCSTEKGKGFVALAINSETKKDSLNRKQFENFYNKMFSTNDFYYENKSKTKKLSQLYINSKTIANMFKKEVLLYDSDGFKYFDRKWLEQSEKNVSEIFNGLMMSDGNYGKTRLNFDNTSIHLISSMVELCLRLNKIPTVVERGETYSGGYRCKKSYKVEIYEHFTKKGNNQSLANSVTLRPQNENYFFVRVNSIKNIGVKKTSVYDLSILGKQSFMVNNYITHNSAGGSLVALCLGITRRIDPMKYGLYFERFLNEDRVSMADIDMDISSSRREEVIQYLREKYGHDKVAQIATYGYLSAKSAFRDVCSAYGFPSAETNRLSKLIEDGFIEEDGKKVGKYDRAESFDHVPELISFKANNPKLVEIILTLDGRIRNAGVHAAGVITSSIPLQDLGVIETRTGGECVCWDKKIAEDTFFLLKLDCLGLKTVDVNSKACELISDKLKREFTTDDIPLANEGAEEILANGDSVAIFQFEGGNARRLLKEGQRGNLEACAAISAVNRPGALNAKDDQGVNITTHYIKRLNGTEEPDFFIPQFRTVLAETYGLMIYQEDMMRICTEIAGFSGSEADTFRKIVGKKLSKEEFEKHREEFVIGCINHSGITREQGDKIFDDILEMAAYSFNKCLTGDTTIRRSAGGRFAKADCTIEELYNNWHSPGAVGQKYRDPNRGIKIIQMDDDGKCRPGKVKGVYQNGVKKIYEIKTVGGQKIKATANHRFLTQNGYKRVDELVPLEDNLYIMGEYENTQAIKKGRQTDRAIGEKYEGKGFKNGFENPSYIDGRQNMFINAKTSVFNRSGGECELCGKTHKRMEYAHIDSLTSFENDYSKYHNRDNIKLLCNSCHKKFDYKIGVRKKRYSKGISSHSDIVESIEFIGTDMTYDIEMDTERHNFIANNIVTHNSHSVGYAILSMESAWLKKYYPVEFFCGVLSFAGKDDKFQEYIRDSNRHGAEVCYPDINSSHSTNFTIYDGKIMAPLNSIKGVGNVAAKYITDARSKTQFGKFDDHEHFLSLLTHLKINGKVNKRVKEILYRANAFKSLDYYVEDKIERRNNLRELLALFSPTPSINFKSGRTQEKGAYDDLLKTMKTCSRGEGNGSFVEPIMFSRPSVLVILDLSKMDIRLLQNDNTKWFQNHLINRLGVPRSAIAFTSALKCSFYGSEKKDISGECKTMCSKEFLSREIDIVRPRLIINCVSWLSSWIIDEPKSKFQETFGNSYFSGKFDSYVINAPSPQWIAYDNVIKDRYDKEIGPLLDSLKGDQV